MGSTRKESWVVAICYSREGLKLIAWDELELSWTWTDPLKLLTWSSRFISFANEIKQRNWYLQACKGSSCHVLRSQPSAHAPLPMAWARTHLSAPCCCKAPLALQTWWMGPTHRPQHGLRPVDLLTWYARMLVYTTKQQQEHSVRVMYSVGPCWLLDEMVEERLIYIEAQWWGHPFQNHARFPEVLESTFLSLFFIFFQWRRIWVAIGGNGWTLRPLGLPQGSVGDCHATYGA